MKISGHTVISKPAIKYLGVMIAVILDFREHLVNVLKMKLLPPGKLHEYWQMEAQPDIA